MTGSQVVTGNRQLAARALDMARREPGRRAAWLCVSVVLGECRTLAAAREALADVGIPAVRDLALQLLEQILGATP